MKNPMEIVVCQRRAGCNSQWQKFLFLVFIAFIGSFRVDAQIENMVVETYYVADVNDATDTTQGRSLVAGMKTYRVYLDLAPQCKLVKIFGNSEHQLLISSTSDFYNNIDRPNAFFGYMMNKGWIDDNPTIALDSWITIGLAAQGQSGVLKTADTNGVFSEIINNTGGTAVVPGGLLMNTDVGVGIPLVTADGYMPFSGILGQWFDTGFKDGNGDDTTIFGPINTGNTFISDSLLLQQPNGVQGPGDNLVLVAQLTTLGDLTLKLNVVVEEWDGSAYNPVTYVAEADTGEVLSPFLSYPQSCGCTDPDYIEYSGVYACSDPDSCQHLVKFGCMDPLACNYDPTANYNIQDICCYPGSCGDRDISVVCPSIGNERFAIKDLHPNPATDEIGLLVEGFSDSEIRYQIFNSTGQLVKEENLGMQSGMVSIRIPLEEYSKGLYQIIVLSDKASDIKKFIVTE